MKIYTHPTRAAEKKMNAIANRGLDFNKKDLNRVARILDDVRKNGNTALLRYAQQFDAPDMTIEQLEVTPAEFKAAAGQVDRRFKKALNRAVSQIQAFHRLQMPRSWTSTERSATFLGQLVRPVEAAGVYVPGGKGGDTPLVSTVLMGVIPAKIAGVRRIVMVTPPTVKGTINPHLLVAAKTVGVDAIYKVGSAWAIGALAYGTETVSRVDVIVGPGNMYVTLAKKIVAGTVGIDMIAGPSEVLIISDGSTNPEYTAADLLAQAEHDPMASALLITPSKKTAEKVVAAVKQQLEKLSRREIARASINRYGAVFVVPDLDAAAELANRIAPEHLELQLKEPFDHVGRFRNAGAIFLGPYTPEPVGDYIAGPNHVLPTAGTARYASALSVEHFIKKTSLLHYSQQAFTREADDVICLAEIEGLTAHAQAMRLRKNDRER